MSVDKVHGVAYGRFCSQFWQYYPSFHSNEWTKWGELFEAMTSLFNISEQKSKLPVLSVLMREIISIQRFSDVKQKRIKNYAPNKNTMPIEMPNGFWAEWRSFQPNHWVNEKHEEGAKNTMMDEESQWCAMMIIAMISNKHDNRCVSCLSFYFLLSRVHCIS